VSYLLRMRYWIPSKIRKIIERCVSQVVYGLEEDILKSLIVEYLEVSIRSTIVAFVKSLN
jgi:hypothetical protein